jgi:hypothetical protein
MSDRELLEKAAKAAGLDRFDFDGHDEYCAEPAYIDIDGFPVAWNPLTDDGDALRLAVKLRLSISHTLFSATAWTSGPEIHDGVSASELVDEESRREAGTRRAIVRAAAALGDSGEG